MRALLLGGGGTLGAFSAGALRALEERGWRPDLCIASSAGGINLLRSLVGGAQEAAEFWLSLRPEALAREALRDNPFNGGVLNEGAFYERVERGVDFDRLLADPRLLAFLVVDMRSGRVALRGNRTEASAADLRLVSRAAYSLPPLLPPVRVGEHLLCDGGLLQNAPLERAAALGASEIVYLCNVQVVPHERYERPWTLPATLRYGEIFFRRASNVGFADAEVTEGTWRAIPFLTIAPPAAPGLRSLLSAVLPTHRRLERLVALGYAEATAALGQWERARSRDPARLAAGRAADGRIS